MHNYFGQKGGMAGGNQMGLGARPKTGVLRPRHAEEISSGTDTGIYFPLSRQTDGPDSEFDSGNKPLTVSSRLLQGRHRGEDYDKNESFHHSK